MIEIGSVGTSHDATVSMSVSLEDGSAKKRGARPRDQRAQTGAPWGQGRGAECPARVARIVEDPDLPGVIVEEDVRRGGSPVDVSGERAGSGGDGEVAVDSGPDELGDAH